MTQCFWCGSPTSCSGSKPRRHATTLLTQLEKPLSDEGASCAVGLPVVCLDHRANTVQGRFCVGDPKTRNNSGTLPNTEVAYTLSQLQHTEGVELTLRRAAAEVGVRPFKPLICYSTNNNQFQLDAGHLIA